MRMCQDKVRHQRAVALTVHSVISTVRQISASIAKVRGLQFIVVVLDKRKVQRDIIIPTPTASSRTKT